MKTKVLILSLMLLANFANAQFTIHFLHPWRDDPRRADSLFVTGNGEVGYHPGSKMTSEGNGWFSYTFKTTKKTAGDKLTLFSWIGKVYDQRISYPSSPIEIKINQIFLQVPETANDIYIYIQDTLSKPQIFQFPPNGKVINFFNPWPDNSPKMVLSARDTLRMYNRPDLCGWYSYYFAGVTDSLHSVSFVNYFKTQSYSLLGMTDGSPINLKEYFATNDTIYILPRPFPYGPPSITTFFPGRTGDCGYRKISGVFRDWKLDNTSFFNGGGGGGLTKNMVLPTLIAPTYKPRKNPAVASSFAGNPEDWFATDTFPDKQDNDTCIDIILAKRDDGKWEFDSDVKKGFFPLDSFINPNNIKYNDHNNVMHNFHFTMELHLQFIYYENAGLEFLFSGDDDVWVFVNNILAIDLGGIHGRQADTLRLDQKKTLLGLENGKTYTMDMFYCERNPTSSNFFIRTSLDLRNSDELYYKDRISGNGKIEYQIWQRVQVTNGDCAVTSIINEEGLATVDFFIDGPQFPSGTSIALPPGVHYGGIIVDPGKQKVTIDSAAISGLAPGLYQITFKSIVNKERKGFLTFVVPPKPHHVDILTENTVFDISKDAIIDSFLISMEKDTAIFYAVIRDSAGNYIDNCKNCIWQLRNSQIAEVHPLPPINSRASVKKIDNGTTWLIAGSPGLKPDSIRIVNILKPVWPIIISAVMLDTNADIVPDMLELALSDTFKSNQSLSSVNIQYRNQPIAITGSLCSINKTQLRVPVSGISTQDPRPTGEVTILVTYDDKSGESSLLFKDGIAPALVKADVLENDGSEPDILFLSFTERLNSPSIRGNQLQLLKNNASDTIPMVVFQILNVENDSSFVVRLLQSDKRVISGDSLRLIPGLFGGFLTDQNNNKPHLLNKPVVVGFKAGAASINYGYYTDRDADGYIDNIFLKFKRALSLSELNSITLRWDVSEFSIDKNSISKRGDSSIVFDISSHLPRTIPPQTGGPMYLSIKYSNIPDVVKNHPVADSAAPVLLSTTFSLKVNPARHTLNVRFSENIESPGTMIPLTLYSRKGHLLYRFVGTPQVTIPGQTHSFYVETTDPQSITPLTRDSVWIDIQSKLCDQSNNNQANPRNRRVFLEVIQPPPEWYLSIGPNPSDLTGPVTIRVGSRVTTDLSAYTAVVMIFDQTGNLIFQKPMIYDGNIFISSWNGHNKNGRFVGNGSYILYARVFENNKEIWFRKAISGIKR